MKRATPLVLFVAIVSALSPPARAQRVVDQTFLCRTPGTQGFQVGVASVGSGGRFLIRLLGGRIVHSASFCRRVTIRVPLTRKGLPGPPEIFGRDHSCPIAGRVGVLVRVRATYDGSRLVAARGAVRNARTRKPVSFGVEVWRETGDDGRERYDYRQWVASSCWVNR